MIKRLLTQNQNRHPVNPAKPDWTIPMPAHAACLLGPQQQTLGNQIMQRFARSCPVALPSPSLCPFGGACHVCPARVQAKLAINEPGDKYEQEADQVAEQVIRIPEPWQQCRFELRQKSREKMLQVKPLADRFKPAIQRQREKPKKRAAGKIRYLKHDSFNEKGLSEPNLKRAIIVFLRTAVGKDLVDWLEDHSITVRVFFCAEKKDMPECVGEAAGCFEKVTPNLFNAYVLAGSESGSMVRLPRGTREWREKIVDRDAADISDTIFHELLHVWFVTAFPTVHREKQTGHTAKAKGLEELRGSQIYEKEYDPRFLKKLKQFDVELKEVLESVKAR